MTLSDEIRTALAGLAARKPLLVALDFDGVLAPLVDDPAASRPLPESVAALGKLLDAGVQVAFVSGRDLEGLRSVSSPDPRVRLVGSHGAQWDTPGHVVSLTDAEAALLAQVTSRLQQIAAAHPNTRVELKPTAAVLHTRLAEPLVNAAATALAMEGPGSLPGVHVTPGSNVVEIAVTKATKGVAIRQLRDEIGAGAVFFAGDDVTDETVFKVLREGDVGVKVGKGETAARYRVSSPAEVSEVLGALAHLVR